MLQLGIVRQQNLRFGLVDGRWAVAIAITNDRTGHFRGDEIFKRKELVNPEEQFSEKGALEPN